MGSESLKEVVRKLEEDGWVVKRRVEYCDLYKLGKSQDYWERRGFETTFVREQRGSVRPFVAFEDSSIMTLLVRKLGPIRLELSCRHIAEVPRVHYNRELGAIICAECGKIGDMATAYVLKESI